MHDNTIGIKQISRRLLDSTRSNDNFNDTASNSTFITQTTDTNDSSSFVATQLVPPVSPIMTNDITNNPINASINVDSHQPKKMSVIDEQEQLWKSKGIRVCFTLFLCLSVNFLVSKPSLT